MISKLLKKIKVMHLLKINEKMLKIYTLKNNILKLFYFE